MKDLLDIFLKFQFLCSKNIPTIIANLAFPVIKYKNILPSKIITN